MIKHPKSVIKKKYATLQINGDQWRFAKINDDEREALGEDDSLQALTDTEHKVIYVHQDHCNAATVIHELVHAFKLYCCIDSVGLSADQLEEIYCDLIGNNFDKIGKAKTLMMRKLGRMK